MSEIFNTGYMRSPVQLDPEKSVIYISGPMSGYDDDNFKAFNETEEMLRKWGIVHIVNPAKNGHANGRTWVEMLKNDILMILVKDVTHVVVLDGWENSRGSKLEVSIARELCIPILNTYLGPYNESILDEAKRIVFGERQLLYGHPLDDFERTAEMWNGLFRKKLSKYDKFQAEDVARAMILVKLSRDVNIMNRDNAVDIAGYAQALQLVREERFRRIESQWDESLFPTVADLGCECPICRGEEEEEEELNVPKCECTQCDGSHNVNKAEERETCAP